MVCAAFGHPALAPHVKGISIINALLALTCAIFGIVGCVSYTNSEKAISAAPYTVINMTVLETKTTYNFGLRAYVLQTKTGSADAKYSDISTYKDCVAKQDALCQADATDCTHETVDYCKKCNKAGTAVVSLGSLALIAAFVTFLAHLLRATCDSTFGKDISILGGITAFVFGVIAFSVYQPCDTAIKAAFAPLALLGANITFGVGAKLVAASFCLLLIVSFFSLAVPVSQAEAEAEAVPTTEATGTAVTSKV